MQKVATYLEISTKYPEVSTFLFDMDGTLMFTERLHAMAINSILVNNEENPFDIDVLESICIGLNDEVVFHKLQKDQLLKDLSLEQFIADKKVIFFKLLKDIRPAEIFKPAVKKLLKDIKKSNSQLALVTSSERETTYQLLDFLKLKDLFDIIITREDTELNKPHPAPYLHAFEKLGQRDPKSCLIFEDSNVGLTAAKDSQANVFKVEWYS
jgi:beta-phosphoglucomutase